MPDKNRIEVNIGGSFYTITSEKAVEEILSIASYLDKEILKVKESNDRLNHIMAVTLSALNIANELFDQQKKFENLASITKEPMEQFEPLKHLVLEYQQKNEALKKSFDETSQQCSKMEKRNQELMKIIEGKSSDILEMQTNLLKLQRELMQTKKELQDLIRKVV